MPDVSITGLPNATTPLTGTERVPMDQAGATKDATTQDIANLAPDTDLSYTAATRTLESSTGADVVLPVATTTDAGLESAADKTKLDSITVDSATVVRKLVRNNSGVAIAKGQPVYQTGSSGITITVALADASSEATAAQTLGLAQDAIADNATGFVIAVGELAGLNTATLTEGQIVWLSDTEGGLTTTRPTQPAHGVVLGYCVKQGSGTSGIFYVKVSNGQELDELHDVLITSPTAGQVLRRASDGLWKNAVLAAADISGLDFAPAAQGVTGGDSHNHDGGDGAQIAYSSLSGLPTLPTGTNTGDQTLSSTSDATSHTLALSASGGSLQLVEGANVTLTTSGTGSAAVVTIASTASGGGGGDVVGPASSIDGRAALFDGTTGKLLKQSAAAPVLEGDSRLTDARTPTAHKATHATGGSDALTPADIGAEVAGAAASAVSGHTSDADPHTQYLTSAEGDAAYAPVGQGVTGGNAHDHNGGDGAQIAYGSLSGLPTIPIPADATPQPLGTAAIGTSADYAREDHVHALPGDWFILACSDETTALTTGTNKVRFRMPYAGTLTAVRASVNTAPTGAALEIDINESGTTVLSTKLSIDATETSSTTAAVPAVISDSALADDAEISIDIDQVGSTVAGAGLKVSLFIVRA